MAEDLVGQLKRNSASNCEPGPLSKKLAGAAAAAAVEVHTVHLCGEHGVVPDFERGVGWAPLHEMYRKGELTDVTLRVGDARVAVHRVVLRAAKIPRSGGARGPSSERPHGALSIPLQGLLPTSH